MSDTTTNGGGATPAGNGTAGTAQPMRVQILSQFVRDMSFENALAQRRGAAVGAAPDIKVKVNLDAQKREAEHQYEVTTKFSIESRSKEDESVFFLLELEYAGLFHVEGVPKEQLHPFLLIECPRLLFPFVRRIVSDITRDGGYLPLNLDLIDFVALYRNEVMRQAELRKQQGQQPAS